MTVFHLAWMMRNFTKRELIEAYMTCGDRFELISISIAIRNKENSNEKL